jgi:hypothetical protein
MEYKARRRVCGMRRVKRKRLRAPFAGRRH